jgi:D-amino peptidase
VKIWIGTDMEGIAGVVDREHTARDGREHDRARVWMTDEVNAAVAGCFDGGATAVTVTDGHGTCRNIIPDRLDARARLVNGQ